MPVPCRRLLPLRVPLLLAGALLLVAPSAGAEPTATELAVARRLFREATQLEERQRWDLAAQKLREAIRIKETPGLRFHLAHCQENMGLLVEALVDYDRARELIASGMKAPDVEALLPEAERALAERVPTLIIAVPKNVRGMHIALDGREVASSVVGRPAPINPGAHRIVVRAPGYHDFVNEITMAEGERRVVTVQLAPTQQPPSPKADAREGSTATHRAPPKSERRIAPRTYVLFAETAVTAAGLGLGVTFAIAGSGADRRVKRAQAAVDRQSGRPGDAEVCVNATDLLLERCRDLDNALSDRKTYGTLSTAGFVAAGVGATAALATLLFWPSAEDEPVVTAGLFRNVLWIGAQGAF